MRHHWQKEIDSYLMNRQSLSGVVIIMDIRHPMKSFDEQMIHWAHQSGLHSHVLLNKADKLSRSQMTKALHTTQKNIATISDSTTCQTFSALRKEGADVLSNTLTPWFKSTHA